MSLHSFTKLEDVTIKDPTITLVNKANDNGGGSLGNYLYSDFIKLIFPINIVIPFSSNVNPNNFLTGTTWSLIDNASYIKTATSSIGSTGGSMTTGSHTLTTSEIPSHYHSLSYTCTTDGSHSHSGSTDGKTISASGTFSGTQATGKFAFPGSYETDVSCGGTYFTRYSYKRVNGAVSRGSNEQTKITWSYTPKGSVSASSSGTHSHSFSFSSTGSHSHTVSGSCSYGSTGGGGGHTHTVCLKTTTMYLWRRTA